MTRTARLALRANRMTDAYAEGDTAQRAGFPISANPYVAGLDRYCAWRDGWNCAYDEADHV